MRSKNATSVLWSPPPSNLYHYFVRQIRVWSSRSGQQGPNFYRCQLKIIKLKNIFCGSKTGDKREERETFALCRLNIFVLTFWLSFSVSLKKVFSASLTLFLFLSQTHSRSLTTTQPHTLSLSLSISSSSFLQKYLSWLKVLLVLDWLFVCQKVLSVKSCGTNINLSA